MDDDTVMEEDETPMYPVPAAGNPTPYPSLAENGSNLPYYTCTLPSVKVPRLPPRSTPSLESDAPQFTTLAEYFNLGSAGRALLENQAAVDAPDAAQDADESEDEGEGEDRSITQRIQDAYKSPYGNPYARNFESATNPESDTSTSLPGYHLLPDDDRLVGPTVNRTITSQPIDRPTPQYFTDQTSSLQSRGVSQVQQGSTRGRGDGNDARRSRGRAGRRGRGGWKWALKGSEHADLFKTPRMSRAASGTRQRGPRARGRGGHNVDPGAEFKELQAQAMQAYMDGDLDEAQNLASAATLVNPEVFAAHQIVANVWQARGDERKAWVALFTGATAKRDPELLNSLAKRALTLNGDQPSAVDIEQAIECYKAATKISKDDFESRQALAELYLEQRDYRKARTQFKHMVIIKPGDLETARRFADYTEVSTDYARRPNAKQAYDIAFELIAQKGPAEDPEDMWTHLNIYLELVKKVGTPGEGVRQLKRIARWILGRQKDEFWDTYGDDREFDCDNERRDLDLRFKHGYVSRDPQQYGDGLPLEIRVKLGLFRIKMLTLYHHEGFRHLEHLRRQTDVEEWLDLFQEAAETLRSRGDYGAAINFYEPIKGVHWNVNESFWMGLAECYKQMNKTAEAEQCYQRIIEVHHNNIGARVLLTKLYESTGQKKKAFAMINEVSRMGRDDILRREKLRLNKRYAPRPPRQPRKINPKPKLQPSSLRLNDDTAATKESRAMSSERMALGLDDFDLGDEPESSSYDSHGEGQTNDAGEAGDGLHLAVQQPRVRRGQEYVQWLQGQRDRVHANYSVVKDLWPAIQTGENPEAIQAWMERASALADEFRGMKDFYPPKDRHRCFAGLRTGLVTDGDLVIREMEAMKKRLRQLAASNDDADTGPVPDDNTPLEFHEISFHGWHRILSELALFHARHVDQDKCYNLLDALMQANVFRQDSELSNTTLAVCICCALMFNDNKLLTMTARQYMINSHHASGEAIQLYAAAGRLGHGEVYFDRRSTQTWTLDKIKLRDYLAMSPEARSKLDWGSNTQRFNDHAQKFDGTGNDLDSGLLTTYAHMIGLQDGHGSQSALSYLFRALALQPENLVINLSIAISYIINALQKTSGSKTYGIIQGLAFLHRYYGLRVASGKPGHLQEAEYNIGRMYHLLGRPDLAIPAYEKVLKLSEEVQKEYWQKNEQADNEPEDFAKEAAFALENIFVSAGNMEAANAIGEEWLVL